MNANTHTPGPWTVGGLRDKEDRSEIVYAFGSLPVAKAFATEGQDASEAVANARMIAAAPVMADALDRIISWHESPPMPGSTVWQDALRASLRDARFALRLARGAS